MANVKWSSLIKMAERLTVSIEVVREQLGFVTWYATVQLDEV